MLKTKSKAVRAKARKTEYRLNYSLDQFKVDLEEHTASVQAQQQAEAQRIQEEEKSQFGDAVGDDEEGLE